MTIILSEVREGGHNGGGKEVFFITKCLRNYIFDL